VKPAPAEGRNGPSQRPACALIPSLSPTVMTERVNEATNGAARPLLGLFARPAPAEMPACHAGPSDRRRLVSLLGN